MDKIDTNEIKKNLASGIIGKKVICLETVDSTNTYASGLLKDLTEIPKVNDYNGMVIISETQTKGKGRFDRKWLSPSGGIWMTVILQPVLEVQDLPKMTLVASVAITETLIKNYRICLNVKWPNDIFFEGKKLCGILCESEKINGITYLIIGIGINANNSFFNYYGEKLNAVSLREITRQLVDRNFLIASILNELDSQYTYYTKTLDFKGIFKKIEDIMIY